MRLLTLTIIVLAACRANADEQRFTRSATFEMFHFTVDEPGFAPNGRGIGRRDMDVTLNSVGPTSYHHSLTFTLPEPLTWTWTTKRLIPDTFTMVPITTSVTLNPFSVSQNDIGPIPLWYDGANFVEDNSVSRRFLFDPVPVSGNYRVSGPTQEFTGTFAETFLPRDTMPQFNYDVSTFPDSIQARRGGGGLLFEPPSRNHDRSAL